MVNRDEIIAQIHALIGYDLGAKAQKIDDNANGEQILGTREVKKIALGVSGNLDFFRESVAHGAQFCITHHGLKLSARAIYNARLDLSQQATLRYVFANNLTVGGYHYTLDAQPDFGNNATIIKKLGATRLNLPYFDEWGWVGEFDTPVAVVELKKLCTEIFAHDIFAVYGGNKVVKRIGVCSGGAKPYGAQLHEIYEKGIELHIAGEIGESGPAIAQEAGFNYFACGHYATEVFGVQELGKKIKAHFQNQLEVEFIDIPNVH
jgi:putative NIF3 family GTP cyclohydrolase 1 type 2